MEINTLKQTLNKSIQDVEVVYNEYMKKIEEYNERIVQSDARQEKFMEDVKKLFAIIEKYNHLESLDKKEADAVKTIKSIERKVSDISKERGEFEQYKSNELAKLKAQNNVIADENNKLKHREKVLQVAIDDFNREKEKYNYKTEGEASF